MVSVKMASYLLWWRHNLVPSASPLENGRKQKDGKSTENEDGGGISVATPSVANLSDITKSMNRLNSVGRLFFAKIQEQK